MLSQVGWAWQPLIPPAGRARVNKPASPVLRHQFHFNKIQLVSSLCSPEPFQKRDVNKGPPLPVTQGHLPCFCLSSRNRAANNYFLKSFVSCTSAFRSPPPCEASSWIILKSNMEQVFIFYLSSQSLRVDTREYQL